LDSAKQRICALESELSTTVQKFNDAADASASASSSSVQEINSLRSSLEAAQTAQKTAENSILHLKVLDLLQWFLF
jgi:predicted  nucleic acid-binding Zn-ribbon protein